MFDAKASQPDVEIDLIIWLNLRIRMTATPKTFKIGEHVRWNSEAGRVSGIIIKKITSDMKFKGYVHHASREAPQYLIKSDKTEHVAIHKGAALRLIHHEQGNPAEPLGRRGRGNDEPMTNACNESQT
jgi:hypothetical protein